MLSINGLGAASGDKANYCQNSASNEAKIEGYYQKIDAPGSWQGNPKMLETLGLKSGEKITDTQFSALTRGIHPETGELLVQGAGDQHRAGWDLTFSAPKSISSLWAVAGEADRAVIQQAHDRAVQAAMRHIEEKAAFARRGKAGAEQEHLSGLITAQYLHTTTRELDPDLHTHSLVLNLAQRSDGTWGGIESKNLYDWKMAAGAIYRAELSKQIKELCFEIKADRDYFKVVGVPDELCNEWSKRREQIEDALAKSGASGAKASEIAALGSRKTKEKDQDQNILRVRWQGEAAAFGLTAEKIAARDLHQSANEKNTEEISIYDKLTRTNSTFSEQDLWAVAAIEMQHAGKGFDAVKNRVSELTKSNEIIRLRSKTGELRFTTRAMQKIETGMAESAKRLKSKTNHNVKPEIVDKSLKDFETNKGFELSIEQQAAVRHITKNEGISLVRGAAGAGKSTMLEAANNAWKSSGYSVIGAALAGKAAQGLEEGSGIKSQTIHSLLHEIEKNNTKIDGKTVLVVDEAGMVGSKQMAKLLQVVEKKGAKIVLVGDERQLQAVAAGGSFKALQGVAGVVELNEIRRQKNEWAKNAVNDFAIGKAGKALESFIDRNLVKVDQNKMDALNSVISAWSANRDPSKPSESIILASTRADVSILNTLARQKLEKEGGTLSGFAATITNDQSRKLDYQQGDRILFRKNSASIGVKNGTLGTVEQIRIDADGSYKFRVKLDDGKTVQFSPNSQENQYDSIDYGYALTTHKAQGITVDKAFVMVGGSMQDREISYVQMSRARYETQIFFTSQQVEEMADMAGLTPTSEPNIQDLKQIVKQMSQSRQKDTTLEYNIEENEEKEVEEVNEIEELELENELEL